jgi:hypothetical protein
MTKPTMASQWDPGNFKPLDMSEILGYPRQMPPRYEKWLPKFTGSDEDNVEDHMSDFWAFFQLHPISDDVEYLAMKLFSATLHGNARKWYDSLPDANITSMDQLEEVFLKRWNIKENPSILLDRLNYIKKNENETVREFHTRFQKLSQQLPRTYRPGPQFLLFLYIRAFSRQSGFLLDKKGPRSIQESYDMATEVKANISSSKEEYSFVPEVKIDDPKDTPDILSLERIASLETFVKEFPKRWEQVINQQEVEERDLDEGYQSHEEEKEFIHDSTEDNEDLVEEREPENIKHDDEVLMCAPPSDKAIQDPIPPAQEEENEVNHFPFQGFDDTLFYDSEGEEVKEPLDELDPSYSDEGEEMIEEASHEDDVLIVDEVIQAFDAPTQEEVNTVSCFPFQDFDDTLFYDLESEEVLEDPLDVLNPSCYDKGNDMVDNIDEFIHVGRRKWDVVGFDEDPIYDMEGHLQMFPLQLSYEVTTNSDIWQQGDDIITDVFQTPKDDLMQCFHDDFHSYLEDFDDYFFEHLDLFSEEDCQPPLCSDFDKGEDVVFLKQDTCDKVFQLPSIALPHYVTKDATGKHVPCLKFSPGKSLLLEFKGRLNALRRSLLSRSFNLPLRSFQSSFRFLLVPSQTSGNDYVQGSQPSDSLSQLLEPLTFHDPFLRWIEHFPRSVTWHNFVPPSHLHELDFTISYDMMHALTHVIFVLNLSLFWFMMKHRGRYYEVLLGWFHWLFDYT